MVSGIVSCIESKRTYSFTDVEGTWVNFHRISNTPLFVVTCFEGLSGVKEQSEEQMLFLHWIRSGDDMCCGSISNDGYICRS